MCHHTFKLMLTLIALAIATACSINVIAAEVEDTYECPMSNLPSNCNVDDIFIDTRGSAEGDMPPGRIGVEFKTYRENKNLRECTIEPVLTFTPRTTVLTSHITNLLRTEVHKKLRSNGLYLKNLSLSSIRKTGDKSIRYTYSVTVEDKFVYTWVCYKGWKCRKCRKWTRLWRKSGKIYIDISLRNQTKTSISYELEGEQKYLKTPSTERIGIDGKSKIDIRYGNLEKIIDSILGVLEISVDGILSILSKRIDQYVELQLIDLFRKIPSGRNLPNLFNAIESPDSYARDGTCLLGHNYHSVVSGIENADTSARQCDRLVALFDLNFEKTSSQDNGQFKFVNSLDIESAKNSDSVSSLLGHHTFCLDQENGETYGKSVYQNFLGRLKDGIERRTPDPYVRTDNETESSLTSHLTDQYFLTGIENFISTDEKAYEYGMRKLASRASWAKINITKGNNEKATRMETVDLSPISSILERSGIVRSGESLAKIARYENWSSEEYACARNKAKLASGDDNLIYAAMNFEGCLTDKTGGRVQKHILTALEIVENANRDSITKLLNNDTIPPLAAPYGYRGWYYCLFYPRLCTGRSNMLWWQEPSMYKSRNGRQVGVELVSHNMKTPTIKSVGNGYMYHFFDSLDHGHNLLHVLIFRDKTYVVRYGNLGENSRKYHKKYVVSGEILDTTTLCKVGECSQQCEIEDGKFASEEHFYFQLFDAISCKNESGCDTLDPVNFFKLRPKIMRSKQVLNCI